MEGLWGSRSASQDSRGTPSALPRRRSRFLRRRVSGSALDALMADLARLESLQARADRSADSIDPDERALLIELYRELIAGVDGPVVPFPVELLADPSTAADRAEPAELVDLDRYRVRRALAETAGPADLPPDGDRGATD